MINTTAQTVKSHAYLHTSCCRVSQLSVCAPCLPQTLLHILKEDLMPPADANEHTRPSPSPRRAFGVRNMKEGPAFHFSLRPENSDRHQPASRAGYLLDSDERAAQLAALATVALFDVPEVHTLVSSVCQP